jgi:hypothetical protein
MSPSSCLQSSAPSKINYLHVYNIQPENNKVTESWGKKNRNRDLHISLCRLESSKIKMKLQFPHFRQFWLWSSAPKTGNVSFSKALVSTKLYVATKLYINFVKYFE